ncbi:MULTISPECIES: glycoside hydrolase family 66 protein [Paenibacillus]|uniref:glycoside hydrolase family 66 protein n=1 Tax=Paenibacillus TaxID=44249 RepID=UPI0022B87FD2|nr:glycoside hydrolase family 66 protein [Paenibacillus caseinilyticus]MCZ8518299.1 dextranase [Paenibacillus caseinilyticus]
MKKIHVRRKFAAVMAGAMLLSNAGAFLPSSPLTSSVFAASTGKMLYDVTTDKSMYSPNSTVQLRIDIKNRLGLDVTGGKVEVKAKHLGQQVGSTITRALDLKNNSDLMLAVDWKAPGNDFKGYLLEVYIRDAAGKLLDSDTVGVDVSSSWVKFPRYGYVWDFRENVDTAGRVDKLKNYHINALQYYDWKYRHHKPIGDNLDIWNDWSGRLIYGNTIRNYISKAKSAGMVNMAYNMVYAATNGYDKDGVKQDWALYYADDNPRGTGQFSFKMADSTPTGITHLYFFNMRNKEWQNYIFAQQQKVFQSFEFDGWHGDTVGEWGKMKTSDGQTLYVKDTYTEFLNAAKASIGSKYLSFNPVGAQGIENVNKANVDVIYSEMWPWDRDSEGQLYDTYASLRKEVEQSRRESGGKSLVVPAYMSYDYGKANPGREFNTSAVLLTDAAVYAAGGSRLELGDNGNMLSNEYFPAQNLVMSADLQYRESKLYDFIVAYENLLRDGQTETSNRIETPGYASSPNGDTNKIWAYGKKDSKYEIIQMINLLGVSRNDWRANDGQKEKPTTISNYEVKYYPSNEVNSLWVASPDARDNRSQKLPFTKGSDGNGNFIKFTVPSLEYWNMIYMSPDVTPNDDDGGQVPTPTGTLVNGGFESGETGWTFTGTGSHGVDTNDALSGSKFWMWSPDAYTGKLSQTVTKLENKTYTVNAMVKQSNGTPTVSRLELSGFGGTTVTKAIPHGDGYAKISGTAAVTNGTLTISFYQQAPGNTNLQIDSIELVAGGTAGGDTGGGDTGGDSGVGTTPVALTNGGFESGNLNGWRVTGTSAGVDGADANSGSFKAYFWGNSSYQQKIDQSLTGLANGTYTVTAMVKQNTGTPSLSRLELTGFGGNAVYANVPHGDSYVKISGTANVTNGTLNIAFYQAAPGNTNLQIDSVEIVKK